MRAICCYATSPCRPVEALLNARYYSEGTPFMAYYTRIGLKSVDFAVTNISNNVGSNTQSKFDREKSLPCKFYEDPSSNTVTWIQMYSCTTPRKSEENGNEIIKDLVYYIIAYGKAITIYQKWKVQHCSRDFLVGTRVMIALFCCINHS